MKRPLILFSIVLAAMRVFALGGEDFGGVKLKGRLGARLDSMIERQVAAIDVDYITSPFLAKTEKKFWWQTEFWGKWMHSAVPYANYSKSAKLNDAIDYSVERILSSQEPSGYIGNYPQELRCSEGWDVWGMKYTMMGLIHYYDYRKSTKPEKAKLALDACKRLCEYLIAEIGPQGRRGVELWKTGNWSGYASSSVLEPVMWLYYRTSEKKYLDFATYIVKGMIEPEEGPRLVDLALKGIGVSARNRYGRKDNPSNAWSYVCKYGRRKAYEMMSCYQGLIEYAQTVKNRPELIEAALFSARDIVKNELNIAGGCASSEEWFGGATKQHLPYLRLQETCVTTTWMRFCQKLLEITDDPKWADEIEKTFYNAYLGSLRKDGTEFASYTPLSGSRYHGMHHCYMHTDCCNANGPRGFLCFMKNVCRNDGKSATFNFYASALVDGFEMYSLYPAANFVRIVSRTKGPFKVRLRVPSWSEKTSIRVNGQTVNASPGSYAVIEREWELGDIIEVNFDLRVKSHTLAGNIAFTRGPVALARDNRLGDGDVSEVFRTTNLSPKVLESFAQVVPPSDDIWMAFSAVLPVGMNHANPDGKFSSPVMFCDYASAGGLWQRSNYYRVWFPVERR